MLATNENINSIYLIVMINIYHWIDNHNLYFSPLTPANVSGGLVLQQSVLKTDGTQICVCTDNSAASDVRQTTRAGGWIKEE